MRKNTPYNWALVLGVFVSGKAYGRQNEEQ
jgi:hypothetical protein